MKLGHYFMPHTKLKMNKFLNVKSETIKLLRENIGGKLLDIRLGEDFLSRARKTKATKAKQTG